MREMWGKGKRKQEKEWGKERNNWEKKGQKGIKKRSGKRKGRKSKWGDKS